MAGLVIAAILAIAIHRLSGFGDGAPCDHRSRMLARNGVGDVVEFAEDFCAGPAFSATATLRLIRKGGGAYTFFEYAETGSDPVIQWPDGDHLIMSIADVDHIFTQKRAADGVQIEYRIGRIAVH